MRFNRIVANLMPAKKRKETLDGREYTVMPAVMLTAGVHTGSEGPLLYLPEEYKKNVSGWNGRPAVLPTHPVQNGQGVSACSPDVIEKNGVGLLFNAEYDGRLKVETWIDLAKVAKVDNRALAAINEDKILEVSTGLYCEYDETPGFWQGQQYKAIVRNIQPDHLAILLDETGACSVAKGAGLLRNAEGTNGEVSYDDVREQARDQIMARTPPQQSSQNGYPSMSPMDNYAYVCDVYPKYVVYEQCNKMWKLGYKVKSGKVVVDDADPEEVRRITSYVTAAEGPTSAWNEVQKALEHKFRTSGSPDWKGTIVEAGDRTVVFNSGQKLFRLSYHRDGDKIRFVGEQPEEVVRVSKYETVQPTRNDMPVQNNTPQPAPAAPEPNPAASAANPAPASPAPAVSPTPTPSPEPPTPVQVLQPPPNPVRKEAVDKLIAGKLWSEADRQFLYGMTDSQFSRSFGSATPPVVQGNTPGAVGTALTQPIVAPTPTVNAAPAQQKATLDQYINTAPEEIREVLTNAVAGLQAEKDRLVQTIVANRNNAFNPEWLKTRSMPELRGMAALAGAKASGPNYSGQADVPMFLQNAAGRQTQNAVQDDPGDEVLNLPDLTFKDN